MIAQILSYQPLFLCDELTYLLQQHFQRLSELEKQIICLLSNEQKSILLSELLEKYQLLPPELFQILLSLERRGLIDKNEILFTVKPIIRNYVKNYISQNDNI